MLGQPGGALPADVLEHLFARRASSVSPIRRRSVARVRSISFAVSSREMCPDMPGAEMRSRSASSEAVMPGLRLIWIEQGHLAARHTEGVDLAPQLPRDAQQHGAQPVRESAAPARRRFVRRLNH